MKEFLLSDESVNSYGFKVKTNGIDLSRFEKNPVMFYNHDRSQGVIGGWTQIRKDGDKFFGFPVFDEKDSLGNKIGGKVKDGFIKAASIGIDNAIWGEDHGIPVIVSCQLTEVSVCDIPSNQNALALYVNDNPVNVEQYVKLNLFKKEDMNTTDLTRISEALNLKSDSDVNVIISAIESLQNNGISLSHVIDDAVQLKYIETYEKNGLLEMSKANPEAFTKYMNDRKGKIDQERNKEGEQILLLAFRDGRLDADAEGKVKSFWKMAFRSDYQLTKFMVEKLPKRVPVYTQMQIGSQKADRSNWGLSEYRKFAPKELKDNPELYNRLVSEENDKNNK